MKSRILFPALAVAMLMALGPALTVTGSPPGPVATALGASVAHADASDRRQARRTARRTARRVIRRSERRQERYENYLTTLPGHCVSVVVNGNAYWRCNSIHYRAVVQDGVHIFVVVNP